MIRGKLILLAIFTAICLAMVGCSGTSATNGNSAKKDSKPAPKLSEKKPVDDLFLAKVKGTTHHNEFAGFMDKTGKIVIDLRKGLKYESENKQYLPTGNGSNKFFLELMPFIGGFAGFCFMDSSDIYKDRNCGYLDKTGNIVIPPSYRHVQPFNEGLAAVDKGAGNTYSWGFIDTSGNEVIKDEYEGVGSFHDGLAVVKNADGKFGYLDKTGKKVVEPKYTNVSDFADGFAVVEDGKTYSIIDKTGKEVKKLDGMKVYAPNVYNTAEYRRESKNYADIMAGVDKFLTPFRDGLLRVERGENMYAYVGTDGEVRIPMGAPYLEFAGQSSEGFVPVKYANAEIERLRSTLGKDRVSESLDCNFLDAEGNVKTTFYGDLTPFSEGFAGVLKSPKDSTDARWSFINTSFEQAIPPLFTRISQFEGGLSWVRVAPDSTGFESFKDTNWEGYIDTAGKPVMPQWQ